MKKKEIKTSRCSVEIDAEQMEYLRYYHKLTGQSISSILRDMIAQWVAVEYATRIPTDKPSDKPAKKSGKARLATKKS
jgi:negative regulator of replication initiation